MRLAIRLTEHDCPAFADNAYRPVSMTACASGAQLEEVEFAPPTAGGRAFGFQ